MSGLLKLRLVTVLFASGRATGDAEASARRGGTSVSARIGQHNGQVTHGEIASTNVADERKAVSVLEGANRERIALIGRD